MLAYNSITKMQRIAIMRVPPKRYSISKMTLCYIVTNTSSNTSYVVCMQHCDKNNLLARLIIIRTLIIALAGAAANQLVPSCHAVVVSAVHVVPVSPGSC